MKHTLTLLLLLSLVSCVNKKARESLNFRAIEQTKALHALNHSILHSPQKKNQLGTSR